MTVFKIIYWAGMVAEMLVRAPFAEQAKKNRRADQRVSATEQVLLSLLAMAGLLLPLVYSVTPWLSFADYRLPVWLGWLGAGLMVCGVFLFARGHLDLRSNWSPSLEIYEGHRLVTGGIYRAIRHPMYASQWLFAVAQALLLWNWLAGPVTLIVFIPFYLLRVRAEEKMMLETFGEEYRNYMRRVGGVIPNLRRNDPTAVQEDDQP